MALLYPAGYQFGDSNIDPVGAGNLHVYVNTTANDASIFTDPALTAAASNPHVLDSAGRMQTNLYVADGVSFTILVNDSADTTAIWPAVDNIWGSANPHSTTAQTISAAGAVTLTESTTFIVTSADIALTLADGVENQVKIIVMKTDGGVATLTPTNLANGTTIVFSNLDENTYLIFVNAAWHWFKGSARVTGSIEDGLARVKTVQTSSTSSVTVIDDAKLAGYVLEAATFYTIEGLLSVTSASSTPDFRFALQTDQTFVYSRWSYTGIDEDGTAIHDSDSTVTEMIAAVVANKTNLLAIRGAIQTHATAEATVDFQWAQGTSDATAISLRHGSWLKFTKIT